MKRALMVAAVVLASATWCPGQEAQRPASLEGYVPSDAMLYVHVQDMDSAAKSFQQTALKQILDEPEVKAFVAEVSRVIDETIKMNAHGAPFTWADIKMALDSEVGFALLDVRGPMPSMALIFRSDKNADALQALVDKLIASIMPPEEAAKIPENEMEGIRFKTVGPFCVAWSGKDLILTSGQETLRKIVAVLKGTTNPISKNDRYAAASKKLMGGREFLMAHWNVERTREIAAGLRGRDAQEAEMVWKISGLADVNYVRLAVVPDAPGIKTMLYVHAPQGAKGVLGLLPKKPLDEKAMLAAVPEDARDFLIARLSAAEMFDTVAEVVASAGERRDFDRAMAAFRDATGLDLRKDLLASLGDEIAVRTIGSGFFLLPEFYLSFSVKDEKALSSCLEKLVVALNDEVGGRGGRAGAEIEKIDYKGRQISACRLRGMPIPITPSWTIDKGRLYLGLTAQTVKKALDLQAVPARPMTGSTAYAALRSHVAAKPAVLVYSEFKSDFEMFYGIATLLVQFANGIPNVPPNDLATKFPCSTAIVPHLFGSVNAISHDGEGWLLEGYGPFGASIGTGGSPATFQVGIMAGFLLPALSKAQEAARRTSCMNNVRNIGQSMFMYAGDHDDAFPKSFGVLLNDGYITTTKVFICPSGRGAIRPFPIEDFKAAKVADIDRELEPICSYVMVPGITHAADADALVLYEKDNHGGAGRNCFFNDGHVKWYPEWQFQELLAEQKKRLAGQ